MRRIVLFAFLVLAWTSEAFGQAVPGAVYPGPSNKESEKRANAFPPGYAMEYQRPRPFWLAPLSAREERSASRRPLPQKGLKRSVPVSAFRDATVVRTSDGRRL